MNCFDLGVKIRKSGGSYGDDEAFFGQINENFEIMITGEIFKENEKIERTKSIYIIKNDGVIE
jgi:hypothetical protein